MIKIEQLDFAFGELKMFDALTFSIPLEGVTCLLGPSGCGKSTLLNLISGILPMQEGKISGIPDDGVAYLFQEARLLPWKTLFQNLELVLRRYYPRAQRIELVSEYLELVELSEFASYYPHQLSGGMKQRAALARAFTHPAGLLLMDEPFQAVDPLRKLTLVNLFQRLWERDRRTTLMVTHNIFEATLLGSRILTLSDRPSRLCMEIDNPVPREERCPFDPRLLALERSLYMGVTGGSFDTAEGHPVCPRPGCG